MAHAWYPGIHQAEVGGSRVQGQLDLHSKLWPQNNSKRNTKEWRSQEECHIRRPLSNSLSAPQSYSSDPPKCTVKIKSISVTNPYPHNSNTFFLLLELSFNLHLLGVPSSNSSQEVCRGGILGEEGIWVLTLSSRGHTYQVLGKSSGEGKGREEIRNPKGTTLFGPAKSL